MNLHDIGDVQLYFEEPLPDDAEELLNKAAESAYSESSEQHLLRAFFHHPKNLTVLVGLYRYYFYQHRLEDALKVADQLIDVCRGRLRLPEWTMLKVGHLSHAVMKSMGMVRLYLTALKAEGLINLRLGRFEDGCALLRKVREIDSGDKLGAGALLDVVGSYCPEKAVNGNKCIA